MGGCMKDITENRVADKMSIATLRRINKTKSLKITSLASVIP
jgi:hypothetical protein